MTIENEILTREDMVADMDHYLPGFPRRPYLGYFSNDRDKLVELAKKGESYLKEQDLCHRLVKVQLDGQGGPFMCYEDDFDSEHKEEDLLSYAYFLPWGFSMVPDGYSVREQLRQTPDGSQQRNPDLDPPDNFLDEVEAVRYEDDEDEYEDEDYNEDDDLCYREFLTVRELMVALTHRKGLKTKSIIFKSQYNQVLAVHHEGLIRLDILESNVISWRYKPKKKRIVIKIDHQEVFRG